VSKLIPLIVAALFASASFGIAAQTPDSTTTTADTPKMEKRAKKPRKAKKARKARKADAATGTAPVEQK